MDIPIPIKLPKKKSVYVTENRSIHPRKGRKELSLDDLIEALKDSRMPTYEEGWQEAYGSGSGCKIQVDGKVIVAYEYSGPVGESKGAGSIAHKNLVIHQCYPHHQWPAITKILRRL